MCAQACGWRIDLALGSVAPGACNTRLRTTAPRASVKAPACGGIATSVVKVVADDRTLAECLCVGPGNKRIVRVRSGLCTGIKVLL